MEEIKGNNLETYTQCGLVIRAVPEIDGGRYCCFGNPVYGCEECAHDPELTEGLTGCNGTGYIYTIASMEAVEHEED